MTSKEPINRILDEISGMDRSACITKLHGFDEPKLDFTDEFLQSLGVDALRHLLLAACWRVSRGLDAA